ncbi:sulfotransferase domain-containing protein [Fortiea sp. LEGE XX443]|uniref:sulfotransferase domain-containing protein n=1 Tax=Fortiea sp. LEGE XX443 TaxID=1828611 RepID=UPI00188152D6|nr:sulfotransferase domain-containing protein [Fortiea sp. LEGE XX443]MBE9007104.1 sulfotransferase domain-containing protein [Fortiea sp. LEGE XX443]
MIVWLASYPRSGNTFLRTIIYQNFGFKTYSIFNHEKEHSGQVGEITGHVEYENSWEEFYEKASSSNKIFFVKTHLAPSDNQPCIYVVRDGRMATLSYFYYVKNFRQSDSSLLELILGDDIFGDWSSHFFKWNPFHRNSTLVIRYEDLLNNSELEIKKISNFISIENPTKQWENPFDKLNELEPSFFRRGNKDWNPDIHWTQLIEQLFWNKHSHLMENLGYKPLNSQTDFSDISESFVMNLFSEQILKLIDKKKAVLADLQQYQLLLQQNQAALEKSQAALEKSKTQMQQTQVELNGTKWQVQQLQAELEGVKSSKFWKLRTQWFKLKETIGWISN